jgi:hypothetical protein
MVRKHADLTTRRLGSVVIPMCTSKGRCPTQAGTVCSLLCRLKPLIEFKCAKVPAFGKASHENSRAYFGCVESGDFPQIVNAGV